MKTNMSAALPANSQTSPRSLPIKVGLRILFGDLPFRLIPKTRCAKLLAIVFGSLLSCLTMQAQTTATPETIGLNQSYSYQLQAEGAIGDVTWVIAAGALPPGLNLSSTGLISGMPTVARSEPYVFTIQAEDKSKPPQVFKQDFALIVRGGIRAISMTRVKDDVAHRAVTAPTPQKCDPFDLASNADSMSIAVRTPFVEPDAIKFVDVDGAGNPIAIRKNPIVSATQLIDHTFGTVCSELIWNKDDYVIVHLVNWPAQQSSVKVNPEFEHWFLYKRLKEKVKEEWWELEQMQDGKRIYGSNRVAVLLVHANALKTWDIRYTVDLEKKTPAPIQNVLDLAGIIAGKTARIDSDRQPFIWGGRLLNVKDIPSDLTVQSSFVFGSDAARADNQGDNGKQTQQPQAYSNKYDNEGRYHWDVSAGIPLKSFKEVSYDVENQQVTAKTINRQNAYGFLNLFLNPSGVDTKGDQFYKTPHVVLGVPISGKPLDRPFVGLGLGFYKPKVKFNLFGGIVFNRTTEPRTLANGQTATAAQLQSDLQTRWIRKFVFGINLPIKQFKDALSKK